MNSQMEGNEFQYNRESTSKAYELLNESSQDYELIRNRLDHAFNLLKKIKSEKTIRILENSLADYEPKKSVQESSLIIDNTISKMKNSIDIIEQYLQNDSTEDNEMLQMSMEYPIITLPSSGPDDWNNSQLESAGEIPLEEPTSPEPPSGPDDWNASQVGPNGETPPKEPTPLETPIGQ